MKIKFDKAVDVEFSSTSNPSKILIAAICKCGNRMMWVTEGILLCTKCMEYSEYRKEG